MVTARQVEFPDDMIARNPEPRCPIVLLLDTSSSMSGQAISELNRGIRSFKKAVAADRTASLRIEVAVVTFGPVCIEQSFVTMKQFVPPTLSASGVTPVGEALDYAMSLIEDRKETYKSTGLQYYRPWILLITDGEPTDHEGYLSDNWKPSAQRVKQAEESNRLIFYTVAVEGANVDILKQMTLKNDPVMLNGFDFHSLFVWLSNSLKIVSKPQPSTDTDVVELPAINWGKTVL